jgi:hypothetical protein
MTGSKAIAVVVVSAGALLLGACGSDDGGGDNNTAGTGGMTAFAPLAGMGGLGGAGAGGAGAGGGSGGAAGTAGAAGASGIGGSAGVGGASGAGAGGSDAGAGGSGGASGGNAMLPTSAIAVLSGQGGETVTGSAMFTQSGMDVALVITLAECTDGVFPVHIHDGTSCEAPGEHWEMTRGEGIPAIVCDSGNGIQTHTRMAGVAETKWSIATSAADDIIGKVVVVHGSSAPIACGVIEAQ